MARRKPTPEETADALDQETKKFMSACGFGYEKAKEVVEACMKKDRSLLDSALRRIMEENDKKWERE